MEATGNYAWDGSNCIYWVEVKGKGYVPVFPKKYGYEPWEAFRALRRFHKEIRQEEQ